MFLQRLFATVAISAGLAVGCLAQTTRPATISAEAVSGASNVRPIPMAEPKPYTGEVFINEALSNAVAVELLRAYSKKRPLFVLERFDKNGVPFTTLQTIDRPMPLHSPRTTVSGSSIKERCPTTLTDDQLERLATQSNRPLKSLRERVQRIQEHNAKLLEVVETEDGLDNHYFSFTIHANGVVDIAVSRFVE